VELAILGQPFDREHVFAGNFLDRDGTGAHGFLVHNDRTGPAQGGAAAELGAGEAEIAAQDPRHALGLSIEGKGNRALHGYLNASSRSPN
jgi:hypothetical protein